MMGHEEIQGNFQVAQQMESHPTAPQLVVDRLKCTLKALKECQSDADVEALSLRVQTMMSELSGVPNERGTILKAMRKAELALKQDGQKVKAKRMGKMHKLMCKLPKGSPKKQRKMLREILALSGQNVGVSMGKRGLCGCSVLCTSLCISGSVLALAGASALIAMAATGHFEDIPQHDSVEQHGSLAEENIFEEAEENVTDVSEQCESDPNARKNVQRRNLLECQVKSFFSDPENADYEDNKRMRKLITTIIKKQKLQWESGIDGDHTQLKECLNKLDQVDDDGALKNNKFKYGKLLKELRSKRANGFIDHYGLEEREYGLRNLSHKQITNAIPKTILTDDWSDFYMKVLVKLTSDQAEGFMEQYTFYNLEETEVTEIIKRNNWDLLGADHSELLAELESDVALQEKLVNAQATDFLQQYSEDVGGSREVHLTLKTITDTINEGKLLGKSHSNVNFLEDSELFGRLINNQADELYIHMTDNGIGTKYNFTVTEAMLKEGYLLGATPETVIDKLASIQTQGFMREYTFYGLEEEKVTEAIKEMDLLGAEHSELLAELTSNVALKDMKEKLVDGQATDFMEKYLRYFGNKLEIDELKEKMENGENSFFEMKKHLEYFGTERKAGIVNKVSQTIMENPDLLGAEHDELFDKLIDNQVGKLRSKHQIGKRVFLEKVISYNNGVEAPQGMVGTLVDLATVLEDLEEATVVDQDLEEPKVVYQDLEDYVRGTLDDEEKKADVFEKLNTLRRDDPIYTTRRGFRYKVYEDFSDNIDLVDKRIEDAIKNHGLLGADPEDLLDALAWDETNRFEQYCKVDWDRPCVNLGADRNSIHQQFKDDTTLIGGHITARSSFTITAEDWNKSWNNGWNKSNYGRYGWNHAGNLEETSITKLEAAFAEHDIYMDTLKREGTNSSWVNTDMDTVRQVLQGLGLEEDEIKVWKPHFANYDELVDSI